jgi:hypothetical protein
VILPRPPADGELVPTTKFLDELLASDKDQEPPMRDASGNLVEVRVQEPLISGLRVAVAKAERRASHDSVSNTKSRNLFRLPSSRAAFLLP